MLRKVISAAREVAGGLSTFLYPSVCRVCSAELSYGEGRYFCANCGAEISQGRVRGDAESYRIYPGYMPLDLRAYACFAYDGAAEAAVKLLKYEGKTVLRETIAAAVAALIELTRRDVAFDVAVAVPLHPVRRRERGFDQSRLIMREAAERARFPRAYDAALRRVRNTVPQVTLSGAARLYNIAGAFAADARFFAGRRVLLFDDVITTGATIRACVEAIESAGGTVAAAISFAAPEKGVIGEDVGL